MKYIIILLIFTLNNLKAQFLPVVPYEKILYKGLSPDWYETSYDALGVTDTMDGYNNFQPTYGVPVLFHKNLIISAYFSRSHFGINGSYIECRSMENGQLNWNHRFNLQDIDHIELVAFMYVDKDDQLVVISHKERKPYVKYDSQYYFKDMIMARRVYDINSGKLISYFHRPYDDPMAFKTSITNLTVGASKFFLEKGELRYIEKFKIGNDIYLKSCLLDETGMLVSSVDTMKQERFTYTLNLMQLHVDTLLEVQMDRISQRLFLRYLSPTLKLYNEVESDSLPSNTTFLSLQEISYKSGNIFFTNYIPSNGFPNYHHEFIVLSGHGKVVKYGFLPFKNFFFKVLLWDEGPDFLLMERYIDQENDTVRSLLKVYRVGPDSTIQPIKSFEADNFLRFAVPIEVKFLPNGKVHLAFNEGAFKRGVNINFLDYNASAYSQMMIDIESLGLPSSDIDFDDETFTQLKIYPNPSQEHCFLDFDDEFSGDIFVFNNSGELVDTYSTFKERSVVLNINHYSRGIYHIICKDSSLPQKFQTAKFVKEN